MKIFKDKKCTICNEDYTPVGPSSRYCLECGIEYKRKQACMATQKHRVKNGTIKNPGVGSGNAQGLGKDHHSYTTGIGCNFQDIRKKIKEERRYCETCHKDLKDATRYTWCVHHIDHDRTNNIDSNFQLLCKRCHQIEHECHKAFGTCND